MSFDSEEYTIQRREIRGGQISFNLIPKNEVNNKALKSPYRLLYVVKNNKNFLYVGEAKSALKTRLSRGFTAYRYWKRNNKARNGYKGYKWIELFELEKTKNPIYELDLFCFLFDESYSDNRNHIEAIEGELAHIIRKETGKWPLCQNEIHFNNKNDDAFNVASQIFNKITS